MVAILAGVRAADHPAWAVEVAEDLAAEVAEDLAAEVAEDLAAGVAEAVVDGDSN